MYKIKKNQIFLLQDIKTISSEDIYIADNEKGCFILNFWEQCSYSDINVLPVVFVRCEGEREVYNIKKNNIILGDEKDICLI
ncbi:MAG: hypothetical protein E7270_06020 [Lachnospiraceae bacterium]|nr:hypothetical protein [Lachnospiraceae bacterium]